jgi:hypothetical protein
MFYPDAYSSFGCVFGLRNFRAAARAELGPTNQRLTALGAEELELFAASRTKGCIGACSLATRWAGHLDGVTDEQIRNEADEVRYENGHNNPQGGLHASCLRVLVDEDTDADHEEDEEEKNSPGNREDHGGSRPEVLGRSVNGDDRPNDNGCYRESDQICGQDFPNSLTIHETPPEAELVRASAALFAKGSAHKPAAAPAIE